jgi:hypothetical protein
MRGLRAERREKKVGVGHTGSGRGPKPGFICVRVLLGIRDREKQAAPLNTTSSARGDTTLLLALPFLRIVKGTFFGDPVLRT